jgi:hypothetical protein
MVEIVSSDEQLLFFVIPGRCAASNPESIAPRKYLEKWIPGLRLTAHPGMTTRRIAQHPGKADAGGYGSLRAQGRRQMKPPSSVLRLTPLPRAS